MSLLQQLFTPLMCSATGNTMYSRCGTRNPSHIGAGGLCRRGGFELIIPATSLPRTPTSYIASLVHARPSYGLGLIVAISIGPRAHLNSVSRPTTRHPTHTRPEKSESFPSPALPATHQLLPGAWGRIRFARSKPPGVNWGVHASGGSRSTGDTLVASVSKDCSGKDEAFDALDSSRSDRQAPGEHVMAWLKHIRQEGASPEDHEYSAGPRAAPQASPSPPPRRFADASVQTDGVSAEPPRSIVASTDPNSPVATEPATSVQATSDRLLSTEPNSPVATEPDLSACAASYRAVSTAPNSLVAANIGDPSFNEEQQEDWASVSSTQLDGAQDPAPLNAVEAAEESRAPATIPVAALPMNPYNYDRRSHPDIVHHNGVSYQILGVLGEGSFGRVFLAFTSSGKTVALKTVHKAKCYRWPGVREELLSERNCLALAARRRLPFWTNLNAAWEDNNNVYMEMDMCAGTLRDRISRANASGTPLSPKEIKLLCAEMLLSVWDLQRNQVVHGDIKPDNFLVRPDGRVVLSDFGFATTPPSPLTPEKFLQWKTTRGGTAGYMSPTVLADNGYCSTQTDIFTLGIVFLELMARRETPLWDITVVPAKYPNGEEAWFRLDMEQRQTWLMWEVRLDEVEGPLKGEPQGWLLCKQMITQNPPTAEQLMTHPYFDGVMFEEIYYGFVTHDYKPQFGGIGTSSTMCDLTFAAWHRGEEHPAEYENDPEFAQVVDARGGIVIPRWIMDNKAARKQMAKPLPNFEWPEPPSEHHCATTAAPFMLNSLPAPRPVSPPPPAPPAFHRTPGHRPQGHPVVPPGHPRPIAPPSPQLVPLYPPGLPHPPTQALPPALHPADYFPPPGLTHPIYGPRRDEEPLASLDSLGLSQLC
ncbi:kinase-like protein [Polyporus arcularius HHB13444]|uniref:non-specific serine/threonine protein kinase n=1 Tax=Polyporus arcularius HHB13444 TaxID=1314778 RepID=A0A5C3NVY4_9APHY|nr:kinase-like protein [Polyporus arcularius HHB13444]